MCLCFINAGLPLLHLLPTFTHEEAKSHFLKHTNSHTQIATVGKLHTFLALFDLSFIYFLKCSDSECGLNVNLAQYPVCVCVCVSNRPSAFILRCSRRRVCSSIAFFLRLIALLEGMRACACCINVPPHVYSSTPQTSLQRSTNSAHFDLRITQIAESTKKSKKKKEEAKS